MVQLIANRISMQRICILISLAYSLLDPSSVMHANFIDDAINSMKSAAQEVGSAFETAGKEIEKGANIALNAVKDRFKDTKVTRSMDYGIRKGALEAALGTANAVLEASRLAAQGTLVAAEETAKAGLSAGEHFLSDIVRVVSPKILQGSADAAKMTLEAAKQTSLAAIKGTSWVITNVTEQFDINRLRFEGSLQSLKSGVLGNILCEGFFVGKQFTLHFDLDPKDIGKSITPLLNEIEKFFMDQIANPLMSKLTPLTKQFEQAERAITQIKPPNLQDIDKALKAAQDAKANALILAQKEADSVKKLNEAAKTLSNFAQKTKGELETLIKQSAGTSSGSDAVRARQEYARRLRNRA